MTEAIKGRRTVHFDGKTATEATLYERDRLDVGAAVAGPAIVEQFDATTVIPSGWTARVDGLRNLVWRRAVIDPCAQQLAPPLPGRGRTAKRSG